MSKSFVPPAIALFVLAAILMPFAFGARPTDAAPLAETPTFYSASSTAFTVTTASQRLLATSTLRTSATIQPINCDQGAIFLALQSDAPATANNGFMVSASTTQTFSTYPNSPIVQGAVQGINSVGTCRVLVTEWRRSS